MVVYQHRPLDSVFSQLSLGLKPLWLCSILFRLSSFRGIPPPPPARSAAAHLLRLRVRISPGAWISIQVSCFVRWRSLRRADHSSRGILRSVVRMCVISNTQQWVLDPPRMFSHGKKNLSTIATLSPITAIWDSPNQAAHYHIFGL
jgi:hypothetical protein